MNRKSDEDKTRAPQVAVTGGLACGKTAVACVLHRLGAAVWEADAAAHRLLRRGTPVHGRIVRRFGTGILRADGAIDRGNWANVCLPRPVSAGRSMRSCIRR